ncbi:MAG: GNAT family N-acetyltransferase [Minisyncoccia bacterium]
MEENLQIQEIKMNGFLFKILDKKKQEIARGRLYLLENDLHSQPIGYLEDVFVKEEYRGRGFGTKLVKEMIEKAKKENCYKIVCTSRFTKPEVHQFYEKLGFTKFGFEFRMDLK